MVVLVVVAMVVVVVVVVAVAVVVAVVGTVVDGYNHPPVPANERSMHGPAWFAPPNGSSLAANPPIVVAGR